MKFLPFLSISSQTFLQSLWNTTDIENDKKEEWTGPFWLIRNENDVEEEGSLALYANQWSNIFTIILQSLWEWLWEENEMIRDENDAEEGESSLALYAN